MVRPLRRPTTLLLLLLLCGAASTARAADPGRRTLVLPFRSVGVSENSIVASTDLLAGDLEDRGMTILRSDTSGTPLPSGPDACDAAECAAALGRERGADLVVYGTLSRLGDKVIARLNVLRVGETAPYYRDELTATAEDDLDVVMKRFADGIAAGRPNSERATVETVTHAETLTPPRRATKAGMGIRAGFLFPTNSSFGGIDRMTHLRMSFRYELPNWQIESTPVLGFTWGTGNFDWCMLDVGGSRIFGKGDFSTYLGGSLGIHNVTVAKRVSVTYPNPPYPDYTYEMDVKQTETAPTADVVAGMMMLRTYDFILVAEVRFHFVFDPFNNVGGTGAQGVLFSFGTSR